MTDKTDITICLGSSCFARGNQQNLKFIQEYLKSKDLTANVNFKGQLCSKLCNEGPVVIINGVTYKDINRITLEDILDKTFQTAI